MSLATLRLSKRRLTKIGLAGVLAATTSFAVAAPSPVAAAKPLPTPTSVVVANVAHNSFQLKVGGSTTKFYSVYLNGILRIGLAESSATLPITIGGLNQLTTYSVQVQQVEPPRFLNSSALSAARSVTTIAFVAPTLPTSPSGVTASNVTSDSAQVSWNPVSGATSYRVYANGVLYNSTSSTNQVIAPTGYPNPTPGTGLLPGRVNRIGVAAVNAAGVASLISEIQVSTPGQSVAFPTTPSNLIVTTVTSSRIVLNWTASTDAIDSTGIYYRFVVNGIVGSPTCSSYCFGATGGSVVNLTPGTTYRIGIQAVASNYRLSDVAEIVVTTTTP